MGATRREFPRTHDEPALRRKLGLTGTIAEPGLGGRAILSSHIAFAVHRRNNMLTAFVCHTLSNLRFDKAGAWLGWSNRGTEVPNESWFRSGCSGKAK
jgi:hypothetical protein